MAQGTSNRERIIDCALKLFADKGYNGTSAQEIVECAGVTKPTMYHYFGSKEGLLNEVLRSRFEPLIAALEKAASLPSDVPLTFFRLARAYFDFAGSDSEFFRFRSALNLCADADPAFVAAKPYVFREDAVIRSFFDEAADRHGNISGKQQLCTVSFLGMVNGCISAFLQGRLETGLTDELIFRLRQQFLYGIFS